MRLRASVLAVLFMVAAGPQVALPTTAASLVVPDGYRTIQAAIDAASPGDVIQVRPGTYVENLVVKKWDLTLLGADPRVTILDGGGRGTVVYAEAAGNFRLEGFTIQNSSRSGQVPGSAGIHLNFPSGRNVIARVIVQDNVIGIAFWNSFYATCVVEGSLVVNNSHIGISDDGCGTVEITRTTIAFNWVAGYYSWVGGGSRTFRNAIVASNGRWGIVVHRDDPRAVYYSDIWNNMEGNLCEGYYSACDNPFTPSEGTISADPMFMNAPRRDYRPRAGSAAIDAGTDRWGLSPDLDGRTLPLDGNRDGLSIVDMGAHEVRGYTTRGPILIDGNPQFTVANGVTGGTGTRQDPFVLEGWQIIGAPDAAIEVRNADVPFTIRDVDVSWAGTAGIRILNLTDGRIEYAAVSDAPLGISVESATNVTIIAGRLRSNTEGVSVRFSSGIVLDANNLSANRKTGISLQGSSGGSVQNNSVSFGEIGIRVAYTNDTTLADNVIASNEYGIVADSSTNIRMSANVLSEDGIVLDGTAPSHFTSHTITADNAINGLRVQYEVDCTDLAVDGELVGQLIIANCKGARISNLALSGTDVAVQLAFVEDVQVTSSSFRGSTEGLRVIESRNVTVTGNRIANDDVGIRVKSSSSLIVFHNDFVHTAFGSIDLGGPENMWDNGYPSGGNYWWDTTAPDLCGGPAQDVCPSPDGISDVPYVIDSDTRDLYPLLLPMAGPPEPPTAIASASRDNPWPRETIEFSGSASYDGDGQILAYAWDFADGTRAVGANVAHAFDRPGPHGVRLTVTDNSGLTGAATARVTVVTPLEPPTASLTFTPSEPEVGDAIVFDGSGSTDPWGEVVSYAWEFGDGFAGTGVTVDHTYTAEGAYIVRLTVQNDRGLSSTAVKTVSVVPQLIVFQHPGGFRLPIPENWERRQDVPFEGTVVELLLLGPVRNVFRSNILVDTEVDATIQETPAYLEESVQRLMEEVESEDPSAFFPEEPTHRRIGGHAAITFVIRYSTNLVVQKFALIVSDPHNRYWILLLSVDDSAYATTETMFERMLVGFEITLAMSVPVQTALSVLVVIMVTVSATVILLLSLRSRRAKRGPTVGAATSTGSWFCATCGTRAPPDDRYCVTCGSDLQAQRSPALRGR